jgi:hypothetical protein
MSDYHVSMRSPGVESIDFRLTGGPLDAFADHKELFAAIGFAATTWARFEAHLDAILIHVNSEAHSKDIYNPDHPVTFDRKIKLLKRWFNQHPSLAHHTENMRRLTSTGKELSLMRIQILHSILEDWDSQAQKAVFKECKWAGNEWRITSLSWTIKGLRDFGDNMNIGNKALQSISADIFTEDGLARLRTRGPRTRRLVRLFRRLRARLGF